MKKKDWSLAELVKKARVKFDTKVDMLQLGSQLIRVKDLLDDPILKDSKIKRIDVERFFFDEAKKLENLVLKK